MCEGYVDYGDLRKEMRDEIRDEIIEECAHLVETYKVVTLHVDAIAAALRALKDKP